MIWQGDQCVHKQQDVCSPYTILLKSNTPIILPRQSCNDFALQADNIDDERAVQEHEVSLTQIDVVKISPDGSRVAAGARDNVVYVAELDADGDLKETIRLLGHTAGTTTIKTFCRC